jgi:hypothetical protein
MSLLTPDGHYDHRAIMLDAHRQFRLMKANGWSFGRCLAFSSSKALDLLARAGDLAAEALAVAATHGPSPPRMIAVEMRKDGAILDPPSAP